MVGKCNSCQRNEKHWLSHLCLKFITTVNYVCKLHSFFIKNVNEEFDYNYIINKNRQFAIFYNRIQLVSTELNDFYILSHTTISSVQILTGNKHMKVITAFMRDRWTD